VLDLDFSSHTPAAAARYRSEGAWRDRNLVDLLRAEIAADATRVLINDNETSLTVAALDAAARRLAGWLRQIGVGPGDVVSFQLPNWWEVIVIDTAVSMVGAISNPVVAIYRDAEVEFILRDARSKVIFIPDVFRSINYAEMMSRLRHRLPDLLHVVTVRGEGELTYPQIVAAAPAAEPYAVSADAPRLLLYTSGTTGRAKGVLHSYNTLDSEIRTASRTWYLRRGDVVLMPSPLTHITGYIYGMGFPIAAGMTAVLMDRWEVARALDLIDRWQVNCTIAATPFLQELGNAARAAGRTLPSLRIFACGGAPVAPEIVRNATEAFANCAVFRVYGSTEAPTVTLGAVERGSAAAAETDGYVVGHEVKIVDAADRPVAAGEDGEILTRGPEMMLRYLRAEDNKDAFDPDGFFHTGDIGHLHPDGALVITGRKKDIIIRGGENISAKEIEDLLYEHPDVLEVAVVAMPHARLGETVCAFVVPKPGAQPTMPQLVAHLDARGLARQKFPERVEVVESLPRTASGKIQKYLLREKLKSAQISV
jgi:acyl-CoA synthetase (AMP-forming)/AMP-acid ligase II